MDHASPEPPSGFRVGVFLKEVMTRKMLIDATHAEETRVVVVDGNKVDEFDFESLNKRQLSGNIYLAKVTRVEPSLQAAFVDYGGNRHGFLAFSEIHPDYYQIPKADREALMAEEAALAREAEEEASRERPRPKSRQRGRKRSQAASEGLAADDAVVASEVIESAPAESAEASFEEAPAEEAIGDAAAEPARAADEAPIDDVPPPSAAAGDFEIPVPEEPAGPAAEEAEGESEYESIGGDDVAEERAPRKTRQRRYKIQEVIKVRQILLVQVVKEERGNKGAALTTYLSLAGRYCVLMPNTARGGGISRKITNAADRKKLKEISTSITVPEGAGLIIRTAGANRTKTEIKRDYEYLLRQWEQIRDLTLKSIAPSPIYEEGSLIKRVIRDLYSRDIDEILVDGERGYREAKDYMKMLMPSHAKNVKHYAEPLPLFSRFQVESYLSAMVNPVVQLKSGGYIVIDVTEALVAIDVNSGRATREASIEDTALKTNLEAAEEAARQMRLRDLAGLVVIDFIDMEDRRNNAAVEKRLKDKLKSDRARIQVGRISGFGLLEMSRQRLRPGMIEATTKACPHCHGTGRVRSDDSMALALLRDVEEEGVRQRSKEVLITAPVEIANYLLNHKREHVAMIEHRFGLSVRVEGDPSLISPDYRMERFKTASRIIPTLETLNLPKVAYPDEEIFEEEDEEEVEEETGAGVEADGASGDRQNGKRKRRRRRRGGKNGDENGARGDESERSETVEADGEMLDEGPSEADAVVPVEEPPVERSKSRRRSRGRAAETETGTETTADAPDTLAEPVVDLDPAFGEVIDLGETASDIVEVPETESPRPKRRERVRKPAEAVVQAPAPAAERDPLGEPVEAQPVVLADTVAALVEVAEELEAAEPEPEPASAFEEATFEEVAAPEIEPEVAPEVAPGETVAAGPDTGPDTGAENPSETADRLAEPDLAAPLEEEMAEGMSDQSPGAPDEAPGETGPRRRGWWSR